MVLCKLSVPGHPTNLDNSRVRRAYCACSMCGWGLFELFFSLLSFFFSSSSNPVVSGMRTPVFSCYHVYSKVSDKNACRSTDSYLTTHSTILDSISRRFVVL